MSQARPHKSASVKDLEQTFKDYEFNKKVLSSMRAELLLRSTKSAKSLLDRVDRQLAEIARRDSFSRAQPEPSPKIPPQVSPPTAQQQLPKITQIPLIVPEPISKPLATPRVEEVNSQGVNLKTPIKKTRTDPIEKAISYCVIAFAIVFAVVVFRSERTHSSRSQNVPSPVSANQEVKHSPMYTKPRVSPLAYHESDDWMKDANKDYTPEKPREAQLPQPTIDDKRIQTYRDTVRNLLH